MFYIRQTTVVVGAPNFFLEQPVVQGMCAPSFQRAIKSFQRKSQSSPSMKNVFPYVFTNNILGAEFIWVCRIKIFTGPGGV